MVIFHSYVSLPEGSCQSVSLQQPWFFFWSSAYGAATVVATLPQEVMAADEEAEECVGDEEDAEGWEASGGKGWRWCSTKVVFHDASVTVDAGGCCWYGTILLNSLR